jgi:hypothetical protein
MWIRIQLSTVKRIRIKLVKRIRIKLFTFDAEPDPAPDQNYGKL